MQHMLFTWVISRRLIASTIVFLLHGFVPVIPIPKRLNLSALGRWLLVNSSKRDRAKLMQQKKKG